MLDFKVIKDTHTGEEVLSTALSGKPLLTTPQLNKGTAFQEDERHAFGLKGKLPARVETLEEQVSRAFAQFQSYEDKLKKNIYLHTLHDTNQTLFYRLLKEHLVDMLPLIYTPTVGTRVQEYSREFRQARGLYIAYNEQADMDEILDNRTNPDIDLIVVTDGEGVLGIGDQGIGAMDIPVAKLMVYSLCGINHLRTLPILLDVGTNNSTLLHDQLYLGLRHPRITGAAYDAFIQNFVSAVKRKFPHVFLHWEDFGRDNAQRNLTRYRDEICSFNDDIQGTGVVTLSALLAAIQASGSSLPQQRIVIFGAGSAGMGIANQIYDAMLRQGMSESEARRCFWLVDKPGLLTQAASNLTTAQLPFARPVAEVASWPVNQKSYITLLETIQQVKPTILIGCSTLHGAFNKIVVQTMAAAHPRPIIFPLSNPDDKAEANPADIIAWTDNQALIATGSPFADTQFKDKTISVAQCNNALAFPGIGLGVIAVKASKVSDNMLWAAVQSLIQHAPVLRDPTAPILPSLAKAESVAIDMAIAVGEMAVKEGLATLPRGITVAEQIAQQVWQPNYLRYRRIK